MPLLDGNDEPADDNWAKMMEMLWTTENKKIAPRTLPNNLRPPLCF
jgi:hypothetical protein